MVSLPTLNEDVATVENALSGHRHVHLYYHLGRYGHLMGMLQRLVAKGAYANVCVAVTNKERWHTQWYIMAQQPGLASWRSGAKYQLHVVPWINLKAGYQEYDLVVFDQVPTQADMEVWPTAAVLSMDTRVCPGAYIGCDTATISLRSLGLSDYAANTVTRCLPPGPELDAAAAFRSANTMRIERMHAAVSLETLKPSGQSLPWCTKLDMICSAVQTALQAFDPEGHAPRVVVLTSLRDLGSQAVEVLLDRGFLPAHMCGHCNRDKVQEVYQDFTFLKSATTPQLCVLVDTHAHATMMLSVATHVLVLDGQVDATLLRALHESRSAYLTYLRIVPLPHWPELESAMTQHVFELPKPGQWLLWLDGELVPQDGGLCLEALACSRRLDFSQGNAAHNVTHFLCAATARSIVALLPGLCRESVVLSLKPADLRLDDVRRMGLAAAWQSVMITFLLCREIVKALGYPGLLRIQRENGIMALDVDLGGEARYCVGRLDKWCTANL